MFSRRSDVCSSHLTPSTERQDPRGSGVKHPPIPRSSSSSSCDCGAKLKNKEKPCNYSIPISGLTSIRLKPVSPRLRSPKIMRNDPFAPSSQSISSPTREVDAMEKQSLGSSKTGTSSFYAERERDRAHTSREAKGWIPIATPRPSKVEMANRGDVKTISHGSDQPISPKTAVSAEAIRRKVEIPCLV